MQLKQEKEEGQCRERQEKGKNDEENNGVEFITQLICHSASCCGHRLS